MFLPTLILTLNISISIVGVLLLTKIFPYRKRPEIRWLIVMTAVLSIISFCSLNVYIQDSLEDKMLFSRMRFLGLSVLGQSWFFFLALTYSRYQIFRNKWIAGLSLLPSLGTILCILIPDWNHHLTNNYELIKWQGTTLVQFTNGPWFSVHILSANFFAFSALIFLLFLIPSSTGVKRKQLITLFICSSISLFIDGYGIVYDQSLRWAMLPGGTFLITEAAIIYSIYKYGLLDLSPIAKNLIFKEIPDPVIILDDQERILDFNSSAKSIFTLSPDILSLPWREIKSLNNISTKNLTPEWRFITTDGEPRTYQVNVINLDPQKTVPGKIIFFRDISNQKKIETKLNNDLEFRERLLSLIAHDFSSILQTQSYISSNLHGEVHPELREQTSALASTSFASQDLMTNILTWAHSQKGQIAPIIKPFELNTLINDVILSLEGSLMIKELNVDFKPTPNPIITEGDSVMIESVIRNLLTNSIRASYPNKKISMSLSSDSSNLKLCIRDEGVGMNPQKLNMIKELNETILTSTTRRPEGFGIGLVIARKFVNIHQGNMEFESFENKGTSVTLTLPLKKPSC